MPFDAGFPHETPANLQAASAATLIDTAVAPDADWAARNPERALAFLFVAPQDCAAADVLMAA
ncbi:MAG TPA: hypothetical protein VEA15_06055 [Caulobacteraceae bacterium]|nr:hypothetical protein [Caulobacteraceae bacterium]